MELFKDMPELPEIPIKLISDINKDYDIRIPKNNPKEDEPNKSLELYEMIVNVLKYYIDMKEENYKIIALWIMGTWIYKSFPTFPYLYFNAMKGSAKTRTEKLIKSMAYNADMLTSLSDAVMFRTTGTLIIDEFEGVSGKEKNSLRELLNTAYKKGGKVKRMKKKRIPDETGKMNEEQVVEEFDTFRPIVMANIWGMEEVLGDRCIKIVLEKSNNPAVTMLIEDFENDDKIKQINEFSVVWCSVVTPRNIYRDWNNYIKDTTLYTLTTPNYIHTTSTLNYTELHLFKKIYDSKIEGRNLELFFPLLLIADKVDIFDEILEIAKNIISEKKSDEIFESKDILLYEFVAEKCDNELVKIKELTTRFRSHIGDEQDEEQWLNSKWIGRALKRLNLIAKKRRFGEGISIILNVEKAKEKLKMFK